MDQILRLLLGVGVIVVLVVVYGIVSNIRQKSIQAAQAESCDTTPQGGCCGNHGACSYDATVQKMDGAK
jgi:hypothetical protein